MKKGFVTLIIVICILFVWVIFFNIKTDKTTTSENKFVIEASQSILEITKDREANNHQQSETSPFLNLIKIPFDPNLIGFYTGLSKDFHIQKGTSDGVYVREVQSQSGKQVLTIYSKDETSKTEKLKVVIENNTLKIFVAEDINNSNREQHKVFQIQTSKNPMNFEVYRNGKLEKRRLIFYERKKKLNKNTPLFI